MRRVTPSSVALAAILVAGLLLRLRNIDHGLPFVFHPDEAGHYTNRALGMLGGDLDPHYYRNPSGYTYAILATFRAAQAVGGLIGGHDAVSACLADPSALYRTGRLLAAVLCLAGVAGVYAVGRRLWGASEGLVAAAVLAFAFLPVAYSRLALTDAAVLLPVALAVYAAVMVREDGRLRHFLLCGAAAGLAVSFKYTAGLVAVPLLAAAALGARRGRWTLPKLAAGALAGAVVFTALNPYFVLHAGAALDQLRTQSATAGTPKPGQRQDGGHGFYLASLTWGLGWGAALAAALGALWELRVRPARGFLLLLLPLVLFLYLSTAGRYFARWLLPAYPVLALLAGAGITRAARAVSPDPAVRAVLVVALTSLALAQPLLADLRTAELLGRPDTRALAARHLLESLPYGTRVVVEPGIPSRPLRRWLALGHEGPPPGRVAGTAAVRFLRGLSPGLVERYRRSGHCYVVTVGSARGRTRWWRLGPARAYYRRLAREARVVFRAHPYRDRARRPPFDLDKSLWLHYPRELRRPGPEVIVYRLKRCRPVRAWGAAAPRSRAAVLAAHPVSAWAAEPLCGPPRRRTPRGRHLAGPAETG
jgi:hypothetical protein